MARGEGVLHIAVQGRHALADDGQLEDRSKPESFQAQPYAIDTGQFNAEYANAYGLETYYRRPLLFGMEYYFNKAKAPDVGDPMLHGGEFLMAYVLTGETKPYNARGLFRAPFPRSPGLQWRPGAWELVTRFSYSDMDDQGIHGGRLWRFTPMVNWHMSCASSSFTGTALSDRFDVTGQTHFFQSRLQLQL